MRQCHLLRVVVDDTDALWTWPSRGKSIHHISIGSHVVAERVTTLFLNRARFVIGRSTVGVDGGGAE